MSVPGVIGAVYIAQLLLKAALALSHRIREGDVPTADLGRLTVIQPVVSGDPMLSSVLAHTVEALSPASILWIIDQTDGSARQICAACIAQHPERDIRLIETDEPPEGVNPKLWKQMAALPWVRTELLAVIDDDTRLPRHSADCLIAMLDRGADLATGLPSYVPSAGAWSLLVAEFVNTSAILTYLSAARCSEPLSINGMCYAMRTAFVRESNLFGVCSRSITDDLALAKAVRRMGGRIVQTTQPQHISTSVLSVGHYFRLMHRWFVFTRILVQNEPQSRQAVLVFAYGLHPLLLCALFVGAVHHPWPLLVVLVVRSAVIALLNRKIVGMWRHSPIASVAAELLQPLFFLGAYFRPVIQWRHRRIRVVSYDHFSYLVP